METQQQLTECKSQPPPPPPPPSTAASPPSSASSPAHEFSFTISLHHHHHQQQPPSSTAAKPPPPATALDLSPADEIFFHGHLLPLQFLSHLPPSSSSLRSSTNSLDNFTLPVNENHQIPTNPDSIHEETRAKQKPKSKSFSLFGIPIRRKADYDIDDDEERETGEKQRKKLKFDLTQVLKRYMRMVRPLFNKRRESDVQFRRQPHSFSGYLSPTDYYDEEEEAAAARGGRRRRRKFSAPASMKTSPSNSGLLVGNGVVSTSDSTMEELQAAIQAAIAHCKNSIAMEEKINKC